MLDALFGIRQIVLIESYKTLYIMARGRWCESYQWFLMWSGITCLDEKTDYHTFSEILGSLRELWVLNFTSRTSLSCENVSLPCGMISSLGVFFSSLQAGIGFLGGHLEPSSWLRVELNIHTSYDITVVANRSGQHGGENEKWYKHICMEPYVEANQRHKAIFKWLVYESGPARSWIPILRHFDCTFYALPI